MADSECAEALEAHCWATLHGSGRLAVSMSESRYWKTLQSIPLMDYIPKSPKVAVLITTRNHQVAVKMAQKNTVKLRELSNDDAVTMIKGLLIYPELMDVPSALTLLDRLTNLPLALVQAAAYFNENEHLTINEYFRL